MNSRIGEYSKAFFETLDIVEKQGGSVWLACRDFRYGSKLKIGFRAMHMPERADRLYRRYEISQIVIRCGHECCSFRIYDRMNATGARVMAGT